MTGFGTMSLGDVISELRKAEPGATVQFDFCYTAPSLEIHSYRGWYNHLAIGWEDTHRPKHHGTYWPLATDLLAKLEGAVGGTFTGYKGGDYTMDGDTPLWVANFSQTGSTAIDRIECDGSVVIIHTKRVDF